jgi:negative regulator of sigma-B (phosphoserine phosphatase)
VSSKSEQLIEWGVAGLSLPGQAESGDLHLVKPFTDGVLVAVVDGLGHGDEAAAAAKTAITTMESCADHSLVAVARQCHEALMRTRGVVMSLAFLNALDNTMTWLGVGNVEGVLLRADPRGMRESLLLRGGVVGYQLPPLRPSVVALSRGDTLILATDGIHSGFTEGLNLCDPAQEIADQILASYGKRTDDALVLVARWNRLPIQASRSVR